MTNPPCTCHVSDPATEQTIQLIRQAIREGCLNAGSPEVGQSPMMFIGERQKRVDIGPNPVGRPAVTISGMRKGFGI